eukprot:Gb_18196 [translate_table: standard]
MQLLMTFQIFVYGRSFKFILFSQLNTRVVIGQDCQDVAGLIYSQLFMGRFLEGALSMDHHFQRTPFEKNIPQEDTGISDDYLSGLSQVLLGLMSIWNVSFLGYPARAILPYCQALEKFAPHIQQVSMESNGKGVSIDGIPLPFEAGEIDFGEPGTNGQHSFYQLVHQVCMEYQLKFTFWSPRRKGINCLGGYGATSCMNDLSDGPLTLENNTDKSGDPTEGARAEVKIPTRALFGKIFKRKDCGYVRSQRDVEELEQLIVQEDNQHLSKKMRWLILQKNIQV